MLSNFWPVFVSRAARGEAGWLTPRAGLCSAGRARAGFPSTALRLAPQTSLSQPGISDGAAAEPEFDMIRAPVCPE